MKDIQACLFFFVHRAAPFLFELLNMEQINFNAEAALSEIADIFNCISDTAASVREKNDEKLQVLQNDSKCWYT